jgi:hypothetical protein
MPIGLAEPSKNARQFRTKSGTKHSRSDRRSIRRSIAISTTGSDFRLLTIFTSQPWKFLGSSRPKPCGYRGFRPGRSFHGRTGCASADHPQNFCPGAQACQVRFQHNYEASAGCNYKVKLADDPEGSVMRTPTAYPHPELTIHNTHLSGLLITRHVRRYNTLLDHDRLRTSIGCGQLPPQPAASDDLRLRSTKVE